MYDITNTRKQVSAINQPFYYEVQDYCKQGLIQYLHKALRSIPELESPLMLEMGCGNGILSIELANIYEGVVYSIGSDRNCTEYLKQKLLHNSSLQERIIPFNKEIQKIDFKNIFFDLILNEGIFNVIGFEEGLKQANRLINSLGYFIIHDDLKNLNERFRIAGKYGFKVKDFVELNSSIWWYDYYSRWEKSINEFRVPDKRDWFVKEIDEIEMYKNDPSLFASCYYVLQKT
jgi:SAM-dependent methyltransferase